MLIESITDNGTTQRLIQRNTMRQEKPGLGLPEIEQQLYYDFSTQQERLLKQTINTYSHPDHQILYHYDPAYRLLKTERKAAQGHTLTEQYRYDLLSRRIATIDECGNETQFEYDGAGRLIAGRQADSLVTYAYDSLGRQHEIREYQDATTYVLKTFKYDLLDRVIEEAVSDSEGHLSTLKRYAYNPTGQRTHILLPDHSSIQYAYRGGLLTRVDRLSAMQKPLYSHQYLLRDLLGRPLTSKLIGNAGELSCQYDPCGEYASSSILPTRKSFNTTMLLAIFSPIPLQMPLEPKLINSSMTTCNNSLMRHTGRHMSMSTTLSKIA